jgi:hypothetical protein
VAGVILVSWKAEQELLSFRWWHLLLPVGAAILRRESSDPALRA